MSKIKYATIINILETGYWAKTATNNSATTIDCKRSIVFGYTSIPQTRHTTYINNGVSF